MAAFELDTNNNVGPLLEGRHVDTISLKDEDVLRNRAEGGWA
jgi:hypothetical protein